MNKQDMIEKLKDPKQAQPFGLRTKEEREILDGAAKAECLYYSGVWKQMICEFSAHCTYILKPDYEQQPEYVDIEIVASAEIRLKLKVPHFGCTLLRDAIECKDFDGFYRTYPGEKTYDQSTDVGAVARFVREGHKVVARFVKE